MAILSFQLQFCLWISALSAIAFAEISNGQCGLTLNNRDLLPPTDFAFQMYRQATELSNGNIFFSPVSISLAVGMLYEGAREETASEIQNIFFPSIDGNGTVPAYANLMESINRANKSYKLNTANAVYVRDGSPLNSDFEDIVKNCFFSEVAEKPFSTQPEEARLAINQWVEDKTENIIKDFMPSGAITPTTEMVLVNAIYFKGDWLEPFDESETHPQTFEGLSGSSQVDMMHLKGKRFNYVEDVQAGYQAIELPYKGEEISLIIFLPNKTNNIGLFEENFTQEKMKSAMDRMQHKSMKMLAIPKFKVEYELPLKLAMLGIGVRSMFDSRADFSGITGTRGFFVSDAIHKAVIEVNERGSEAAAATGIVMLGSYYDPNPKPSFIADSPFIYFIARPRDNMILFMGKYQ